MAKLAQFTIRDTNEKFSIPIDDGNTFANLIIQIRMQGFVLDGRVNVYFPHDAIKYAIQIETEIGTSGMTKQ